MAVINKPSQPLIPPTDVEEVEEIAVNAAEAAIAADDTHAPLVDDKVPAEHLPSYVDDVLNFDSADDFPEEGEDGKIYVANDTNLTYRWSGVAYIQVGGASLAPGDGINIENDFVSVDEDYLNNHLEFAKEDDIPSDYEIAEIAREQLPTFMDGLAYDSSSNHVYLDTNYVREHVFPAIALVPQGTTEQDLPYGELTSDQYQQLIDNPGAANFVFDGNITSMVFVGNEGGVLTYSQSLVPEDPVILLFIVDGQYHWRFESSALAIKADAVELETAIASVDSSKQDKINDLDEIRSGAAAGATAVQPSDLNNEISNYVGSYLAGAGLAADSESHGLYQLHVDESYLNENLEFEPQFNDGNSPAYCIHHISFSHLTDDDKDVLKAVYNAFDNGKFPRLYCISPIKDSTPSSVSECILNYYDNRLDILIPYAGRSNGSDPRREFNGKIHYYGLCVWNNNVYQGAQITPLLAYTDSTHSWAQWDTTPTSDSKKIVTSGGVYSALQAKANIADTYTKAQVDSAIAAAISASLASGGAIDAAIQAAIGNVLDEDF